MTKHILMLTTVTFALVCGGIPARAQEESDDHPAITRHWEEAQQNQGDEEDTDDGPRHDAPLYAAMHGGGWQDGRGVEEARMMRHGGMMGPLAMRIIFALMDRDGDGTISLEEFQAAHERIFKAMDPDKDGTVSQEEMLDFMRGTAKSGLPR